MGCRARVNLGYLYTWKQVCIYLILLYLDPLKFIALGGICKAERLESQEPRARILPSV